MTWWIYLIFDYEASKKRGCLVFIDNPELEAKMLEEERKKFG